MPAQRAAGPASKFERAPADRIGPDHGPGVPPGQVFAQVRLVEQLVVDAGQAHVRTHRVKGRVDVPGAFVPNAPLPDRAGAVRVGGAGVDRGGNLEPSVPVCNRAQILDAEVAQRFGVRGQVRRPDRNHILGAEEIAHFYLQLQSQLGRLAGLSGQHCLFLGIEPHCGRNLLHRRLPPGRVRRRQIDFANADASGAGLICRGLIYTTRQVPPSSADPPSFDAGRQQDQTMHLTKRIYSRPHNDICTTLIQGLMPKTFRTYQQRGYLSRRGCQRLNKVLAECTDLYNSESAAVARSVQGNR